ncbi:hypothetical protein NEOLI_004795 [Neolecta irregularis DAH-3]|uniref:Uncharacterized protein n=1 Tax=Neolecta irregularis (strain DAH-3) TaxID=1198029 RepID=A0A1U7LSQ4_NEOID|nr:hypothetical protein NEOLI_004795 [Neolecta irregularis DAH-3]|eukprot:OLL25613.1 hypothetical protein NEOLI_004795 [Neolecta irregularis DAH-3]
MKRYPLPYLLIYLIQSLLDRPFIQFPDSMGWRLTLKDQMQLLPLFANLAFFVFAEANFHQHFTLTPFQSPGCFIVVDQEQNLACIGPNSAKYFIVNGHLHSDSNPGAHAYINGDIISFSSTEQSAVNAGPSAHGGYTYLSLAGRTEFYLCTEDNLIYTKDQKPRRCKQIKLATDSV